MITTNKEQLELALDVTLKNKAYVLGVDGAAKLGWCLLKVIDDNVEIEYGSIDTKKLSAKKRYETFLKFFEDLIDNKQLTKVILEDAHLKYFYQGRKKMAQVAVLKSLTRVSMIPFIIALQKNIKSSCIDFIAPNVSRSSLGLNGTASKEDVQSEFMLKTGIKLSDNDIIDSIILAINGAIK